MTIDLTFEQVMELFLENRRQLEENGRQLVEVREQMKETDVRFQETDVRFQEIAQQFKETDERLAKQSLETDRRFQETDERLAKQSLETDRRFQETDERLAKQSQETDERLAKQSKKTDKKMREVMGLFTSQWGKMMEALVKPDALRLFQERGIQVNYCMRRVEARVGGRNMEIDLLLENGQEVIVLEVKTILKGDDVKEFMAEELGEFLTFFPRYRSYKVYGGVAALDVDEGVDKYAYRNGLFVLMVGGGVVQIKNDDKFIPKNFGA